MRRQWLTTQRSTSTRCHDLVAWMQSFGARPSRDRGIVCLRFPVAQCTDKLPTGIATPDVRKSGGAIDEYRQRLIVLHNVLRDGRRRHRPERNFAEEGTTGIVIRYRASILPPRPLDVNQLKRLAIRIFNVQRKRRSVSGAVRF